MDSFRRGCRGLALLSLVTALYHLLPPLKRPYDDWEFSGVVPRWSLFAGLAVALALLPAFVRFVRAHRRLVIGAVVAGVIGIGLFAISIPSLLRARMSAGGLSVGGARDVDLFRQSLREGYLPRPTDVTSEGLFADYYFDTLEGAAATAEAAGVFQPVFSWARLRHPESGAPETFLAVGLRSPEDTGQIARPRLNLCVVLDISGSMGSSFDRYHYDSRNVRDAKVQDEDPDVHLPKIRLATRAVATILDHLRPDDRLGIVLFDQRAYVAKRVRRVGDTDLAALRDHVLALQPQGGTNMEAGLEAGRSLLRSFEPAADEVETRIVFLTDAMPNVGRTDASDLANLASGYAREGVHTTFIGIGVDFQTELVERLSRVRGANYLAIHSAAEFKKRLDREFDHLVTPWGYDLGLRLMGARIDAVDGVPEADAAKGELLHVRTLFPAPMREGAVKGGIILLRVDPASLDASKAITIAAEYEDRAGRRHQAEVQVPPPPSLPEFCPSPGVRKAVLLARYARLVRTWLEAEARTDPSVEPAGYSSWERRSRPLRLSAEDKQRFLGFHRHFQAEAKVIGDPDLGREEELLSLLTS